MTQKMRSFPRFGSVFLILLQLFCLTNAEERRLPSSDSVRTECLATSPDMNSFRCMESGSIRVACIDEDERCEGWAKQGECKNNPQYMLVSCRKSCSSCIPLHPGSEPQIAYDDTRVKVLERLYETQEYLHKKAINNIETLKHCENKHSECTHWWAKGECDKNPQFMKTECRPACQTC